MGSSVSASKTICISGRSQASSSSSRSAHSRGMVACLACMDVKMSHSTMRVNVVVMIWRASA